MSVNNLVYLFVHKLKAINKFKDNSMLAKRCQNILLKPDMKQRIQIKEAHSRIGHTQLVTSHRITSYHSRAQHIHAEEQ